MEIIELKKLLDGFKNVKLSSSSTQPTFLDISGFPHYENVCSNILQFFFRSEESHGFKDLFIQALLKGIGENPSHHLVVDEVIREQMTSKGNRLDIIITTDEYVIGIENKIFAGLYNDLDDYTNYLNGICNGRKIVRIILSIYPVKDSGSGFINIRYTDFFDSLDSIIGRYWADANPKYLTYLKDFMQTIKSLGGDTNMNNEVMNFIQQNLQESEKFLKVLNDLKKSLRQRVQNLGNSIVYDQNLCKQWFYRENDRLLDDLVHDIYVDDAVIAIDTNAHPVNWSIVIWLRKAGNNQIRNKKELADWIINKGIPIEDIIIKEKHNSLYHKEFNNTEDITINLQNLLDKLCS